MIKAEEGRSEGWYGTNQRGGRDVWQGQRSEEWRDRRRGQWESWNRCRKCWACKRRGGWLLAPPAISPFSSATFFRYLLCFLRSHRCAFFFSSFFSPMRVNHVTQQQRSATACLLVFVPLYSTHPIWFSFPFSSLFTHLSFFSLYFNF